MRKTPSFDDAHRSAFSAVAALYRLAQFKLPSLIEVGPNPAVELPEFREVIADLAMHRNAFKTAYAATKSRLEEAIPNPSVVSVFGEHGPYAHDIVGPLCDRFLPIVRALANKDDGLDRWRGLIRGHSPMLLVPSLNQLKRLSALLDAESISVKRASKGGAPAEAQRKTGKKKWKPTGQKPNPRIQVRNKKIAADFAKGLDANAICEKYKISAALARQVKSKANKAKNRQS